MQPEILIFRSPTSFWITRLSTLISSMLLRMYFISDVMLARCSDSFSVSFRLFFARVMIAMIAITQLSAIGIQTVASIRTHSPPARSGSPPVPV